jgi:segregation and condensation protein A
MQALAGWLQQRPQLGHDVFARGRPEVFGMAFEAPPALDVIAFFWASLALFDDEPVADTANLYRPQQVDLYDVAEARARILRVLAEMPEGGSLDRFLPEPPEVSEDISRQALQRRSGWASTFVAGLELAKQGDVVLGQAAASASIQIGSRSSANLETPPAPDCYCTATSDQVAIADQRPV